MKILEIIPHLQSGGGEKFVVDISNAFAAAGHDCTIATMYNPSKDDLLRGHIQTNVKNHSFDKKSGADFGCMFRILKYIKTAKPEVVHVHLAAIMYILVAAICCRSVKYFATIHSEASREAGKGLSKWIRMFLFKTKLVIPVTISEESKKSFEIFYKMTPPMIPNGSAPYVPSQQVIDEFKQYREGVDYLFFHAGRIHKVKNQAMLVRAFERALQQGVNARLLIAGRVADDGVYEQMKNHFSDRIVYIGEQADIRSIMSVADAFCLSSIMEGMPITIIEAFSVGSIPIVTPVGGCINMIKDGENGFLSQDISEAAYVDTIMRFTKIPIGERSQIKDNCIKEYTTNYSINNTMQSYINKFRDEK